MQTLSLSSCLCPTLPTPAIPSLFSHSVRYGVGDIHVVYVCLDNTWAHTNTDVHPNHFKSNLPGLRLCKTLVRMCTHVRLKGAEQNEKELLICNTQTTHLHYILFNWKHGYDEIHRHISVVFQGLLKDAFPFHNAVKGDGDNNSRIIQSKWTQDSKSHLVTNINQNKHECLMEEPGVQYLGKGDGIMNRGGGN